jgi:serine/threonine protein kinase
MPFSIHASPLTALVNYQRLKRLGEGTGDVVYKAVDKRIGDFVALKCIRLDQEEEGIPPSQSARSQF